MNSATRAKVICRPADGVEPRPPKRQKRVATTESTTKVPGPVTKKLKTTVNRAQQERNAVTTRPPNDRLRTGTLIPAYAIPWAVGLSSSVPTSFDVRLPSSSDTTYEASSSSHVRKSSHLRGDDFDRWLEGYVQQHAGQGSQAPGDALYSQLYHNQADGGFDSL